MFNEKKYKQYGYLLATARTNAGMRQKEVAKKLGVKDNVISYFENGDRLPSIEQYKELSKLFNVSIDYLLGVSDSPSLKKEISFITDYTGIREDNINVLNQNKRLINNEEIKVKEEYISLLNRFISSFPDIYILAKKYRNHIEKAIKDSENVILQCDNFKKLTTSDKNLETKLNNLLLEHLIESNIQIDSTKGIEQFFKSNIKSDLNKVNLGNFGEASFHSYLIKSIRLQLETIENELELTTFETYKSQEQIRIVMESIFYRMEDNAKKKYRLAKEKYFELVDSFSSEDDINGNNN